MGSGDRQYRIELGAARGQAVGIQEHELAMIPIIAKAGESQIATQKLAAEMQLGLQARAFEQEMLRAEKLQLFADRVTEAEDIRRAALTEAEDIRRAALPSPGVSPAAIVARGSVLPAAAKSKTLVYVGVAIVLYFFFLR